MASSGFSQTVLFHLVPRVGSFSLHHLAAEVFGGFEELATGVKLATSDAAFL